jgi:hypothetical protein
MNIWLPTLMLIVASFESLKTFAVKESLFMMATRHVDNVIKNTFLQ